MDAVDAVRAAWTSSSFLLYAGGLVILASAVELLGTLSDDYGSAAYVGWALLVFAVLATVTVGFRRAGLGLPAGLFAVSSVIAFAVLVGALEHWLGWLADTDSPFVGFHVGNLLLELLTLVAAVAALRVFRFPLLVAVIVLVSWYFATDLISGGGGWSAVVTIAVGIVLMVIGTRTNPVYGFWVQVGAGLAIGGGLLYFWHSSDVDWILVALASLAYLLLATTLDRSSYAVLAAVGLALTTTHFAWDWFGSGGFPLFGDSGDIQSWALALSYAVYGFVLMVLGLWLARHREDDRPAAR